jgi:hypothetical protein
MSSPQGISGASDDADESYFLFTPVTPTIPLRMTALASQPSSQVDTIPMSPS